MFSFFKNMSKTNRALLLTCFCGVSSLLYLLPCERSLCIGRELREERPCLVEADSLHLRLSFGRDKLCCRAWRKDDEGDRPSFYFHLSLSSLFMFLGIINNAFGHKAFALTSLVAQMVKRLPAMRETWVLSLGQEDPLEKEMATHSRTLAWKIPWMEDPGRPQFMGSQRVRHD